MFDCDPQGVDVAISPVWNLGAVVATAIPILGGSRAQYQIVLQENNGQLARNGGLEIAWSSGSAAPVLYEWQPSAYDTGVSLRKSWVSLPTAMGMNGWAHLRDGYLPLFVPQASTVNLTVIIDGIVQGVYPFTPSTDLLQKMRVDFLPRKGLMYQFKLQSDSGFLIFSKDVEVYGKSWGSTGPYVNLRAFGDPEFTG